MTLKELRLKAGYSQIEVAVLVGVSVSAYILWEKGGCNPTPENKEKLDEVLKKRKYLVQNKGD